MKSQLALQPLTDYQKSQIGGAGFSWAIFWGLSILTSVVVRSFFAEKGTVGINTVGRASWEDKTPCQKSDKLTNTSTQTSEIDTVMRLMKKLYDF